jgi:A/G-specific adenine glycosylase
MTDHTATVTNAWVRGFQAAVLAWGDQHRRDLPWRATRDPWAILVSEVMLQQTQVPRVVEPYHRFLRSFPTPADCAAAGSADVVRAWAGLGYNRRASNLHGAACAIVERHAGHVPDDLAELRALPGVGEYTARAVLVFAHGRDVGVVDTNVARVLARSISGAPLNRHQAQSLADRLVPVGASWSFNQALFDLGTRHCTSRRPDCVTCPLRRRCRWRRAGQATADPAIGSAGTARPQSRFEGSARQGRGRLVQALRAGPVSAADVPAAAGWPGDPVRARDIARDLVDDGLARRLPDGGLRLA